MATIFVRVKDKETQQESDITYKAYHDVKHRYDLLGQIDEQGNLMESDPNLQPQHQRKVPAKSPAVVDVGDSAPVKFPVNIVWSEAPEVQIVPDQESTNEESTPSITGQEATFHVEPSDAIPGTEYPKERKKPGPKPKNKEQ